MKIATKEAFGIEGPSVQYIGDDGWPQGLIIPNVIVEAASGQNYALPNDYELVYDDEGFGPFPRLRYDLLKAREIAAKINDRGFINSEHWVEVFDEDYYAC